MRIERRIKVNQIGDCVGYGLVNAFASEPDEIVAVVKLIDEHFGHLNELCFDQTDSRCFCSPGRDPVGCCHAGRTESATAIWGCGPILGE